MRLRFGLGAWSNAHFEHTLYPFRTLHVEYLPRYSTVFDVAEADILYHRLPEEGELDAWIDGTPAGFLFLPKLLKAACAPATKRWDDRALAAAGEAWDALAPLRKAGRIGPVLAQFPAAFRASAEHIAWLDDLLASAPAGAFAVEFRDPSWWGGGRSERSEERMARDVEATLGRRRAPLVWGTHPRAVAPAWTTGDVGYVRFVGKHHHTRGRHVQVEDRLDAILDMRARLTDAPWDTCFVIVTNPFEGNAIDSLPRIAAALGEEALARRCMRKPAQPLFPDPPSA